MPMDEETRKVIHELRTALHEMILSNQKVNLEQEKVMALMQADLKSLNEKMSERMSMMVTRSEFVPVKAVVYGLTGTILSGVAGAVLTKLFL